MKQPDHRIRVTKFLIRKAFTDLLRQKPIQSISVKELCTQAGINRGTFYAHYTDIYDLLEQMEAEMMADFQRSLRPLLELEAQELTSLRITTSVFQCLKENSDLCTVTLGPYGDKDFAARLINTGWEKCLESYSKSFSGASSKQIEFYYAFVSAGCVGLLEKWLADGMSTPVEAVAEMAERIMTYGIQFLQQTPSPGGKA